MDKPRRLFLAGMLVAIYSILANGNNISIHAQWFFGISLVGYCIASIFGDE